MSKPDPSITADLLSKLPTKKADPQKALLPGKKDHATQRGPAPQTPRVSPRSAEKSAVQGHTRTSNRGK
ncbi:MAG: hypothetical protein ABSH53_17500 [Holophaga sp.]|jgi:hypothetical protein